MCISYVLSTFNKDDDDDDDNVITSLTSCIMQVNSVT